MARKIASAPNAFLLGLFLFVLAGCAFLLALQNDFIVFDDPIYVTYNLHVNQGLTWAGLSWAFHGIDGGIWLPLTWLSHMLDCQLYGLKPWGHHLTNVLIHAANTALVFWWLRRLTGATWRSFVVAALFGLHPLRVESVAWVAERKDVLSGFFWFLTLLAYTRFVRESTVHPPSPGFGAASRSRVFYVLALLAFAAGLISKPMVVTLPFVLLLLDWWPLKRWQAGRIRSLIVEKLPFFVLSIISSVVTFMVQRQQKMMMSQLPVPDRLENAVVSYVRYLGKTVWPVNLSVYYPHPNHWPLGVVLAATALLAALSIVFFWQRGRRPYLLTGWLWFVGTLAPVIGLVQVGEQAMADRYTYIPQIGLFLCLVWGIHSLVQTWKSQPFITIPVASAAIIVCFVLTQRQIGLWKDSEILFRHAIALNEKNALSYVSLGNALIQKGQLDEAIADFRTALEIDSGYAEAENNLGTALYQKGQLNEAIVHYQRALNLDADNSIARNNSRMAYAEVRFNFANALSHRGQAAEAIAEYRKSLEIRPDLADAHLNLGMALSSIGKMDEAILEYRRALEINPRLAEARNDLGNALMRTGHADEAMLEYEKAVGINPNLAEAQNDFGNALMQKGRMDEAIVHFQKALAANFNYAAAHNSLGAALMKSGRLDEATAHFEKALEINPAFAEADYNLGLAEFGAGRVKEAVATAQRGLQLATEQGNPALVTAFQRQLEHFR